MKAIVLPIIRHFKDKQTITRLKPHESWLMPEPELFGEDEKNNEKEFNDDSEDEENWEYLAYRDSAGHRIGGTFVETVKNMTRMYIIHQGWPHISYIYPNVDIPFKSPMVRWRNLFYCGGFGVHGSEDEDLSSDINLVKDIVNGLKPMGFAFIRPEQLEECKRLLEKSKLKYFITHDSLPNGYKYYNIAMCQDITFGEAFDVEAFLKSYKNMQTSIGYSFELDEGYFRFLKNYRLSHWLKDWNYAHPRDTTELMLTGLLLGYPIESTFDRICH